LTRTGITSLAKALSLLGFDPEHYPCPRALLAGHFDAAVDLSVVVHYKQLDDVFAGSKFIYTVRDKDSWIDSVALYIPRHKTESVMQRQYRQLVYGQFNFDRDAYSAAYDRHHDDVMRHFKDRPDDLLVMDICGGDGWPKLLSFLNMECADKSFPSEHKQVL